MHILTADTYKIEHDGSYIVVTFFRQGRYAYIKSYRMEQAFLAVAEADTIVAAGAAW